MAKATAKTTSKTAAADFFGSAKSLETALPPKSKAKGTTEPLDGIEDVAVLDTLCKSLSALQKSISETVESKIFESFLSKGLASKTKPANFKGVDGLATASCELRKRSSASALTPAEVELLEEHDIPTEKIVSSVETFVINPAYKDNGELLSKVSQALGKVKDIPADFFLKQEGSSKTVVADNALEVAFNTLGTNSLRAVLPIITTLAIKPVFDGEESEAWSKAVELVGLDYKLVRKE